MAQQLLSWMVVLTSYLEG